MDADRRTAELRAALPPSPAWEAWLAGSGERAPDFGRWPARTELWSPAEGLEGVAGWPARRAVIRARWRRWLLGARPPAPEPLEAAVEQRDGELALSLAVAGGRLGARLLLPARAAAPPPVLMVQGGHLAWAQAARERGWAACVVHADDVRDDTDSFAVPGADWSRLARRAWALSRALDVLAARPEVDAGRTVLAGHSRNGKAALIAAAHDERFAAVVSSSSGVLGAMPARLLTDRHFGEGIELLTRHYPDWFHPRLRFWAGREHRLPTDAHELLALIAPRPVLISVAVNDQVESTAAAERTVAAVRDVYARFGAADALVLRYRDGGHPATPDAVAGYLDWADAAVGRSARRGHTELALHGAWARWPATARPAPGWRPRPREELEAAMGKALGTGRPVGRPAGSPPPELEGVPVHRRQAAGGLAVDLVGDPSGSAPLVLWLPPLSRATGWLAGYEQAEPLPVTLARRGWAVACHDPVGTGARVREEASLDPGWSPLGRMVADARTVLDALAASRPAWLVGYGTGALVALHLAVDEPRVAGVAVIAPSTQEPLLAAPPQYGLADLLAALDGRPGLVLAPRWDPDAAPGATAAAARAAGVPVVTATDYHRLSGETRAAVAEWLGGSQDAA